MMAPPLVVLSRPTTHQALSHRILTRHLFNAPSNISLIPAGTPCTTTTPPRAQAQRHVR